MLTEEWNRARRAGTSLAVVMLDVDYFKHFNDHFGHLAGDDCLRVLAQALVKAGRRAGELVARYGGEEFVLLFQVWTWLTRWMPLSTCSVKSGHWRCRTLKQRPASLPSALVWRAWYRQSSIAQKI